MQTYKKTGNLKTGNLRVVQLLLGHTQMHSTLSHSTVRNLVGALEDALARAAAIEIKTSGPLGPEGTELSWITDLSSCGAFARPDGQCAVRQLNSRDEDVPDPRFNSLSVSYLCRKTITFEEDQL